MTAFPNFIDSLLSKIRHRNDYQRELAQLHQNKVKLERQLPKIHFFYLVGQRGEILAKGVEWPDGRKRTLFVCYQENSVLAQVHHEQCLPEDVRLEGFIRCQHDTQIIDMLAGEYQQILNSISQLESLIMLIDNSCR
ncbi:TPA: hypothetical protein ACX6SP_004048 [Photobacterium damselae]